MDSVLNPENFPILESVDRNVFRNIKILCVFGCNGKEVLFVTDEDQVYGYGCNQFGALGLGHLLEVRDGPQLNPYLSDKSVANIFCGCQHWTALTTSGECYSWGNNDYGQLGIGSDDWTATPHLIESLANERMVQICCGAAHTLALTADGRVYSWGSNKLGQLGTGILGTAWSPMKVVIKPKVVAISCGKNHCIALTVGGKIYVWGHNYYGQLGRDSSNAFFTAFPVKNYNLESTLISKVICGPNYSLLLSSDGYVFAFGNNYCGQIGNGSTDKQQRPFKVSEDIKFKDIVANNEELLCIAVSEDNLFYMWGLAKNRKHLTPKAIKDTSGMSVFDIYASYAKTKVTFKTVVISDELKGWERNLITSEDIESINKRGIVETNEFQTYSEPNGCQPIDDKSITDLKPNFVSTLIKSLDSSMDQLIDRQMKTVSGQPESDEALCVRNTEQKTFDMILDVNLIPCLKSGLTDKSLRKNVRLLCVFGKNASEVLFATNEDIVYCFGANESGCLGLGCESTNIGSPTLNGILSHKKLIDIRCGFKHCIALTESGICYAWGYNKYGQLGLGNNKTCTSPKLIVGLVNRNVVQICCGAYHSLALNSTGQVYAWGQNKLGQLGDSSYKDSWAPIQINTKHPINGLSCGWNHSTAVANTGIVYMWGHNQFGQLGREKEHDFKPDRMQWIANQPLLNPFFKNIQFKKAVCGPNYSLLLTTDGFIYGFGDNTCGQIGKGSTTTQFTPIRINDEIKFDDIVVHYGNDLSIGVSTDGRYYAWGFANDKIILVPELIPESSQVSIFNVYAKYASNKVTFGPIIIFEKKSPISNGLVESQTFDGDENNGDLSVYYSDVSDEEEEDETIASHEVTITGKKTSGGISTVWDNMSSKSSIRGTDPSKTLQNHMIKSFNNQNNSDLKVITEDKRIIYCHKTILQIRNQKFWDIMSQNLIEEKNEVRIYDEKYDSFYRFLQYLYGIEPEFNDKVIYELQSMAHTFNEMDLLDDCSQYIENMENTPNLLNVCALYRRSIEEGLSDLEQNCIELSAKNWKTVAKSDEFLAMNDSLSKRLLIAVLKAD